MTIKEILERNVKAYHRLGMITKDMYETLNDGHPHTLRKSMLEEMINASLEILTVAQDLHAHVAQELAKEEVIEPVVEEKPVKKVTRKTTTRKNPVKKAEVVEEVKSEEAPVEEPVKPVAKKTTRKTAAKKTPAKKVEAAEEVKTEEVVEVPVKKGCWVIPMQMCWYMH